ncbi:MAG: thioredoxin family protein [Lewinellaceae bacterium]|nr:thioredoxin family protein [Lewinellaceae bacterium]
MNSHAIGRFTAIVLIVIGAYLHGFCEGIRFYEAISYQEAKSLASSQGKLVFVETYTNWCIPCKKMEPIFRDAEVGSFFNAHFINVRINMETSAYAQEYKDALDVIFLPTMAILRSDGFLRFKVDKAVSKEELIANGRRAIEKGDFTVSLTTEIMSNPMGKPETIITEQAENENILRIAGNSYSDLPPDALKQLAYQSLMDGDGKHSEVAKAYIATQSDWSEPSNMKFIFDFVSDTRSREFSYMVAHRDTFNSLIGKQKVEKNIQILIYLRLYQGFPRPSFDESLALFKISSPNNYKLLTYQYLLNRLQDDCKIEEFEPLAIEYIEHINPKDDYRMYLLSDYYFTNKKDVNSAENWINKAIKLNKENAEYYFLRSQIFLKMGKEKAAMKDINSAISINDGLYRDTSHFQKFKESLKPSE